MTAPIEYLAFGGGAPSLALAILNAWGEITPRAELIIFADTGAEQTKTMELLPLYESWFAENGLEMVVAKSKDGPLDDYVRERSLPIPVFTPGGMGQRRCTDKWKIRVCRDEIKKRYGRNIPMVAQLGLTYDEVHRVKDAKVKRDRNRWPLIEKRLKRDACDEIVKMAGLPVPPRSACYMCPLRSNHGWKVIAAQAPADFDKAVEIDELIRERSMATRGTPVYLSDHRKALRRLYSTAQASMFTADDPTGDIEACEPGYCHT